MSFKFGDIVINEWASDSNPYKVLIFVKNHGKTITCFHRKGGRVTFENDKSLRLIKVGELNFDMWDSTIKELSSR